MDDADVVVLEGGGGLGLVDESLLGFGVAGEIGREELQCDGAVELEVLGFVDDTHASAAEVLEDLVVGNDLADHRQALNSPAPDTDRTRQVFP